MDWVYLCTSFHGRISRQPFWIAFAILMAAQIGTQSFASENDTLVVLLDLAFTFPEFAVAVKRSNDRDLPPWLVSLFFALSVAVDLFTLLNGPLDPESTLGYLTLYPLALMQLILLLEFGFRRGTDGPNRFGDDPLAAGKARLLHQYAAVRWLDGLVRALTPGELFVFRPQRPPRYPEELPRSVKYWGLIITAVNALIFVDAGVILQSLVPGLVFALVAASLPLNLLLFWKRGMKYLNNRTAKPSSGSNLSIEWCAIAAIISTPLLMILFILSDSPQ
jgi:uncharacterized membrane protein YhaH (DUF805 family)